MRGTGYILIPHLVENSDGQELSEKSLDNLFATKYVEIIE